jgi:molybdenum cofactor cytidylyltransferase
VDGLSAPAEGHSICIPTHRTRRGNPVLWSAQHFPRLLKLSGDRGASVLFRDLADRILEVEMPDDAVLIDIDTEAALDAVRTRFAQAEATRSDPPQTSARWFAW